MNEPPDREDKFTLILIAVLTLLLLVAVAVMGHMIGSWFAHL